MGKLTFLPVNQSVELTEDLTDQSLLETAMDEGVPIMHACGGYCACTTCHVQVVEGAEHLSAMESDEKERLESTAEAMTDQSRLACHAKLKGQGSVVVEIQNLDL